MVFGVQLAFKTRATVYLKSSVDATPRFGQKIRNNRNGVADFIAEKNLKSYLGVCLFDHRPLLIYFLEGHLTSLSFAFQIKLEVCETRLI